MSRHNEIRRLCRSASKLFSAIRRRVYYWTYIFSQTVVKNNNDITYNHFIYRNQLLLFFFCMRGFQITYNRIICYLSIIFFAVSSRLFRVRDSRVPKSTPMTQYLGDNLSNVITLLLLLFFSTVSINILT